MTNPIAKFSPIYPIKFPKLPDLPNLPKADVFRIIREYMAKNEPQEAITRLESLFFSPEVFTEQDVITCYELIFELLPHVALESLGALEKNLNYLLERSPWLHEYQEKLAIHLAQYYCAIGGGQFKKAMFCLGKALEIKPSQEEIIHSLVEELFKPIFKHPFRTKEYRKSFQAWRNCLFNLDPNTDIRAFQRKAMKEFKLFFRILLEDAFAITSLIRGEPLPCDYDIRAMGSMGRAEACPYSDLEFIILIRDDKCTDYFDQLVKILEIQIAFLGESQELPFVLTCIPLSQGFHLDIPPTSFNEHILTPLAMAQLQNSSSISANDVLPASRLKTRSLSRSTPELYKEYQKHLEEYIKKRTLDMFKIRMEAYTTHCKKKSFDLDEEGEIDFKEQYVEPLIHLLGDMALYFTIPAVNTLDIIKLLVKNEKITPLSGSLLKESVSMIYTTRMRLHSPHYKKQDEKAFIKVLRPNEIFFLEKCYHLVLSPLYRQLQKAIDTGNFQTIFYEMDLIQQGSLPKRPLSPSFQKDLAIQFGSAYAELNDDINEMRCLAVVPKLENTKEHHLIASAPFAKILLLALDTFLINSMPSPDILKAALKQMEAFHMFCTKKEDLNPFFSKLWKRMSTIANDKMDYNDCLKQSRELENKNWKDPEHFVTERYRLALENFRSNFIFPLNRKKIQEGFQTFFNTLLDDIFVILGSPPCNYDIRGMGSIAREELCPYSNLELAIFVEKPSCHFYFERLAKILDLQIASLGETQLFPHLFGNASILGMHLQNCTLIYDQTEIPPSFLQTISLKTNDANLFKHNQQQKINLPQRELSPPLFNTQVISIKKHYIDPLNLALSDIALYHGIGRTNPLDLIINEDLFTKESCALLKESIEFLYEMRVRLQQNEKASFKEHLAALEKCYWLVLHPLYTHLKNIQEPVDLIRIAKRNLTLESEPLTKQIASYNCSIKAPLEDHIKTFKKLSKRPNYLRMSYLEIMEKETDFSFFAPLLRIPNCGGLHPIFLYRFRELEKRLYDITTKDKTDVKITIRHSQESRFLQPHAISELMRGENIKPIHGSTHSVCDYNRLHFKQKPANPLMEYAIHNLTSRLAGEYQLTPANILVRFDVCIQGKKWHYPVLVSETIVGENLKDANQNIRLNPPNFTWTLLCAILTKPGDGIFLNHILDDKGNLYCIDNDNSFFEPVTSKGSSKKVHFCAAPFCLLPLETALDPEVLKTFLNLDPYPIFEGWFEDLMKKEEEYKSLFTKEERKTLYEEDVQNRFTPSILFREGVLAALNLQFWRLKQAINLSKEKQKPLTAGDLLKALISLREESIGVHVYNAYNSKLPSGEKKLQQALIERVIDESMTSLPSQEACYGKALSFKEVDEAKIEDARSEFYSTCFEKHSKYITLRRNPSGKVIVIEGNMKESNSPSNQTYMFKSLIEQHKDSLEQLQTLILTHSEVLTDDLLKPLLSPNLKKIDLQYCAKITHKTIHTIEKKCLHLKTLILAGCTGLTEMRGPFTRRLLEFSTLEHCDISGCHLHFLQLNAPSLHTLRIKGCTIGEMELTSSVAAVLVYTRIGNRPKNTETAMMHYKKGWDFGLNLKLQFSNENHQNHLKLAASYDQMGAFYVGCNRTEEGIERYQKALEIRLQELGNNHLDVATNYEKLAGIYHYSFGNREKALENVQKAFDIRVLDETPIGKAASYASWGDILFLGEHYKEALDAYQKALKMKRKIFNKKHPEVAILYKRVGDMYFQLNKYKEAIESWKKALDIRIQLFGMNGNDVISMRSHIGQMLADSQESLENRMKKLNENQEKPIDVANDYIRIGNAYSDRMDWSKAIVFIKKALEIVLEVWGDNYIGVINIYLPLGRLYRKLGNDKEALIFFKKDLEIRVQVEGEDAINVASTYVEIGAAFFDLKEYEKALDNFQNALKICVKVLNQNHINIAYYHYYIGRTYYELEQPYEALASCQMSLEIKIERLGQNHIGVASDYTCIAKTYERLENYQEALVPWLKVLEIKIEIWGQDYRTIGVDYSKIAEIYEKLENYEKALEFHNKALKIRLQLVDTKHPKVAESRSAINRCYRHLGLWQELFQGTLDAL
jgi:tetratricopeptide (TPR) repeat protein